jgi:aspartate/methionine/tyrosine aminotransferase
LNPEVEDLTATAWGVSKTFGVAGLYLGYMATTNKEMLADFKKEAHSLQRGSNTLARAVAPVMLDETLDWYRRDLITHLTRVRDICHKRLNEILGVSFPVVEGTYVPFPKFDNGMTSEKAPRVPHQGGEGRAQPWLKLRARRRGTYENLFRNKRGDHEQDDG